MWGPLARLSRRQLLIAAAGALVGVIVIVVLAIVLSSNAPPPATIESAVESVEQDRQADSTAEQQDEPEQAEQSAQQDEPQAARAETQSQAETDQQQVASRSGADDAETSSGSDGYGDDYGSASSDDEQQTAAQPDQAEEQQSQQVEQQTTQQTQQQSTAAAEPGSLARLAGTWTLSERGESFVGYRIGEELANIGTATAVGRTSEIVATLQFDGAAITSVTIEADLRTLRSDQSFRDSALRTRGIETDTYPFATFTLTDPIPIGNLPEAGESLSIDCVQGTLNLHDVTNDVCIALEGQLVDGELVVVVGSTEIALADYDIEKPTGFRVLSIEDIGLMEFQIVFERAE